MAGSCVAPWLLLGTESFNVELLADCATTAPLPDDQGHPQMAGFGCD